MKASRKKTAVIGVGNVLYGDDGFGVRVACELKTAKLPRGVEVIDGGSVGVGLIEYLKDYEQVIIIDAADMGLPPGTLKVFRPEEVKSLKSDRTFSLHSADVLGVIELGMALGEKLAEVTIIAVQPEFVGAREGLSAVVEAAVAKGVAEAIRLF